MCHLLRTLRGRRESNIISVLYSLAVYYSRSAASTKCSITINSAKLSFSQSTTSAITSIRVAQYS